MRLYEYLSLEVGDIVKLNPKYAKKFASLSVESIYRVVKNDCGKLCVLGDNYKYFPLNTEFFIAGEVLFDMFDVVRGVKNDWRGIKRTKGGG